MNVSARSLLRAAPILATSLTLFTTNAVYGDPPRRGTTTPIKHVIIVVGENHTFDNLFGTYQPQAGQHIDNLLTKGIVNADGSPGPRLRARPAADRHRHRWIPTTR